MHIKYIRLIIAAIIAMFALNTTSYGETIGKEVLRVGIEENKPLSFRAGATKADGFSIDIIEEICKKNEIEIEYVYTDTSRGISMLENGEIDVMTLGYSDKRAQKFRFTSGPIIENWGTMISSKPAERFSEIEGKRVALVKEDIYAQNFRKLIIASSNIKEEPAYVYAQTYEDVFELVQKGRADYGVVSRFAMLSGKEKYEYYEVPVLVNPVEMRYAFRNDISAGMYELFEKSIQDMKSDRDSAYYSSLDRWFTFVGRDELPRSVVCFVSGLIFAVFVLGLISVFYKNKLRKNEVQLMEKNSLLREKNESIYKMNEKLSQDMDNIKKSKETIYKMAYYDQLTGLFNKNSLYMDMRNICKREEAFAVVFFDLDNFKLINDTMGFLEGDKLLKKISFMLLKVADESKSLYRWGGDEFVFICKGMSSKTEISNFCKDILKRFEKPIKLEGVSFVPSASIGVSVFPKDACDYESLIKKSNAALHHVKNNNKNDYKIYSRDIIEKAVEKLKLDSKLRDAVENGEITAYFQPRVSARTCEIVGMEALARWIDEDGKFISPGEFIPLAEENGLVRKIGRDILMESCIQAKKWGDMGHQLSVSVNLSSRQLENDDILYHIDEALEKSGLESRFLELEITESSIIKNMDCALEIIDKIRKKGIKVLLDDFGTGYSSLNYIRRMPIDTIKIDKSFMDMIFDGSKEKAITSYIISLAHEMKLTVVAEGVEKQEQVEFLREKMCDEIQGFFFSKPLPAVQFEKMLKEKAS